MSAKFAGRDKSINFLDLSLNPRPHLVVQRIFNDGSSQELASSLLAEGK